MISCARECSAKPACGRSLALHPTNRRAYRVALSALTRPAPVKKLIGIFGNAKKRAVWLEPSSYTTVTLVSSKRSGAICVEPSSGANTLMPKSRASFAPKEPALKVSVIDVGVLEKVTSAGVTPLDEPIWKRFGLAEVVRPGSVRSKVTDWIFREKGRTSR